MRVSSVVLLSVLFICSVCSFAQTGGADSRASISGRVTIEGKGLPGITVLAGVPGWPVVTRTLARTITDDDGNYRLTGLAAGRITVTPIAKAYVVTAAEGSKQPVQSVNVLENEAITKIDFALVRGGVITGRITDTEGRPIIGERVNITTKTDPGSYGPMMMFSLGRNLTDDRGVYRLYGLGPGRYKVSVGQVLSADGANDYQNSGSQYAKTFYPGVTEEAKAKEIEVTAGSEVTGVDITPGKIARGFSVSGRVVDADSGQAIANVFVGYYSINEANQIAGQMNIGGTQTDANGAFRLEGIQPGHYAAFSLSIVHDNKSYSEPAPFEISAGDVTGIEIKLRRGATIDGVAIIEHNVDPAVSALLQSVTLLAYVANTNSNAPSFSRCVINADGTFHFAGLAPGKAQINEVGYGGSPTGLQLKRIELDGVPQSEGLEVAAGAHITGVRLVFIYGKGKIRGEVKIEGGVLPAGTRLFVRLNEAGDPTEHRSPSEVDLRGRFFIDNLPPGTYEVTVEALGESSLFAPVKRTVTVANGVETSLNVVIDLATKRNEPD